MNIFVFGNPDLVMDSLPLQLLPDLKERFPEHEFIVKDPNEDWDTSEPFVVIDTVVGLPEITVFDTLKAFESVPRISMHDFDALTNLRFLEKLGKLPKIKIIGIPPMISAKDALESISRLLASTLPN